jgi:hypothetical protein
LGIRLNARFSKISGHHLKNKGQHSWNSTILSEDWQFDEQIER